MVNVYLLVLHITKRVALSELTCSMSADLIDYIYFIISKQCFKVTFKFVDIIPYIETLFSNQSDYILLVSYICNGIIGLLTYILLNFYNAFALL
jgi:hypothetical protein